MNTTVTLRPPFSRARISSVSLHTPNTTYCTNKYASYQAFINALVITLLDLRPVYFHLKGVKPVF